MVCVCVWGGLGGWGVEVYVGCVCGGVCGGVCVFCFCFCAFVSLSRTTVLKFGEYCSFE